MNLAVPPDHRVKIKENEKRDKYLDLVEELRKMWNMKVTVIPIVRFGKEGGRVGNRGTSRDHPNYNIVKISQNTEFWSLEEICSH